MNRDAAAHQIGRRIDEIKKELQKEFEFRDFAATHDYEYRMSNARTKGLKEEKQRLEELLDDL